MGVFVLHRLRVAVSILADLVITELSFETRHFHLVSQRHLFRGWRATGSRDPQSLSFAGDEVAGESVSAPNGIGRVGIGSVWARTATR